MRFLKYIFQRLLWLVLVVLSLPEISIAQTNKVGDLIINSDGSSGIVFFVHPDGSGGWMMALNDVSTGCEWGLYNDIPSLNNNNLTVNPESYIYSAALYDTAGYSNTQKIRTFQNNNSNFAAGKVDFANGWYLPATGQLSVMYAAQPFIKHKLIAEGGTFLIPPHNYWSSSEYDISQAWNFNASQGYARFNLKDESGYHVRAVRSFSNPITFYDTTITYLWNNGSTQPNITATPNTTTSYTVTVTSGLGCTNTASQNIFVNSVSPQILYDTVCLGFPYMENGFQISASDNLTVGTTLHTRTISQNGCQATIHLYLYKKPTASATLNVSLCEGEPYILNGLEYYSNGTYYQHLSSQNGCDSLLTLNLSYYPNPNTIIHQTACDSYSWNGIVYSQSGIYSQVFSTSNGCDSTVILYLTIKWSSTSTITQTVNENQLPVTFNGQIFTNDVSNYMITIPNFYGCDSVITYSLTVNWNTFTQLQDTICQNSLPFIWNGITFYTPGTQSVTLTSYTGADSVVVMTLDVHPNTFETIHQMVQENDLPVIFNGYTFMDEVDQYQIIIENSNGCDSVITYSLEVNWNTYQTIDTTVCSYDLPFYWHGFTFLDEGTIKDTILNSDNTFQFITYTLHIDLIPVIQFSGFTNPICPTNTDQQVIANINSGTPPYQFTWSGDSIISTLQNQAFIKIAPINCGANRKIYLEVQDQIGCIARDTAIIELDMLQAPYLTSVIPSKNGMVHQCQFSIPDLDSLVRAYTLDHCYPVDSLIIIQNPVAGVYTVTVTDMSGCSSNTSITIQNQTQMMNPGTIASDQSICIGNIPAILEGNPGTGGYFSYYQWQSSTDNQFFLPAIGINDQQSYSPAALSEDTYFRRAWISNVCGTIYTDTLFISILPIYRDTVGDVVCQGFEYNNNGFILPPDSTNDSGEHLFNQHLYSVDQCDSIITLLLTILPSVYTNIEDTICQGATYVKNGFYVTSPITDIAQVVELEILLNNVLGCDSIVSLALHILDTTLLVEMNPSDFCESDFVELVVQGFFNNYQWSTGETTDIIEVNKPGTYSVTASNEYCENKGTFTIQPCDYIFYIPNSFTPNGDGLNDAFSITTIHKTQMVNFKIVIFNRWGQKLFESYDPDFRWDGTYKGQMVAANQVYTYLIEYQYMGKGAKFLRGSVIVLQ